MSLSREDVDRGRWDGKFFARRFMGVDIHPGQERLFNIYLARQRNATWWVAAYLTICLSAGNRAGKTLVMALVIIHACFYKMGLKPPTNDVEALTYIKAPFHWYHFAIQQEVADLVFNEIVNMFQGIHVAQKDGACPLAAESTGPIATWDKKEFGEYQLIQFDPAWGGATVHFRTTMGGKGRGALGRDMHGISFDECGLEPNLTWIFENVIHLRRLGTGGQVFMFSTPEEGLTEFSDLWFRGDPDQPDRWPSWMSMRMSTRDNVGFGLDQGIFDLLTEGMGEDHIKQNIDGYFIQGRTAYFNYFSVDRAFREDLPERQAAKHHHYYVQAVDPAHTRDAMWSIVGDVTHRAGVNKAGHETLESVITGVAADRVRGRKTTDQIVELTESNHLAYNNKLPELTSQCETGIDSTGMGGHMFREELQKGVSGTVHSIEFGGPVAKRRLLGDLRTQLDTGRLALPREGVWLEVRRQLLGYKLDDKKIEQDAVMTLAILVAVARRQPAGAAQTADFDLTSF